MVEQFNKIQKDILELANMVAREQYQDVTEDDLDTLAEAVDILTDVYETLYDEVFVEVEE